MTIPKRIRVLVAEATSHHNDGMVKEAAIKELKETANFIIGTLAEIELGKSHPACGED